MPTPSPFRPRSCGCGTVDRQRFGRERRTLFLHVALVLLLLVIAAIVALAAAIAALAYRADLVDLFVTGGAYHLAAFFFLKYMCPLCLRGDVNDKTFLASRAKPCARRIARRRALGLVTRILRLRTTFPFLFT